MVPSFTSHCLAALRAFCSLGRDAGTHILGGKHGTVVAVIAVVSRLASSPFWKRRAAQKPFAN